jgi:hypothetical protein
MGEYNNEPSNGLGDCMRLWFETTSRTMQAFESLSTNPIAPEACRETRSQMFQAWSDYWEQFLRSSPFLQAQKQYANAGTATGKQLHESLGQFYHELQLATSQDIDQVMRALRRIAEDMAEQQESMRARFDDLAARVESLATSLQAAAQSREQET